ncbi:hypothetical protein AYO44_06475 [Planctomycetaceae bacterium SCGC AG-212-F19]|nr:hypothetical protein AYO44_06475 [Planctomycetaceae bacterium SCGC AG-212-F19]
MASVLLRPRGAARWVTVCALFVGVPVVAWAQGPRVATTPVGKSKDAEPPARASESTGFLEIEEPTRLINQHFVKTWKSQGLIPAERCDDYEFIRRATIDIVGRVATVAEIERYLKDPPEARRGLLLARLLYGEHKYLYARNWANLWTTWLMTRTGPPLARRQMQLWLEDAFSTETVSPEGKPVPKPHMSHKEMVEKLVTATGKANDNGAVNFILAHRGAAHPAGQFAELGAFDAVPITARSVRLFLGYQIQCTQCHDHKTSAHWKQKHFWGVNAFYRQIRVEGIAQANMQMPAAVMTLGDDPTYNSKGLISYEKLPKGTFFVTDAVSVDGLRIPVGSKQTRREHLAEYFVKHKNFNQAYVNRVWGQLFGRGLNVSPACDDMGDTNDLVHPELIDSLADAFVKTGAHDPRKLIQWICASDVYNLKPVANATNDGKNRDKFDPEPFISRMPLKMMTPEQLLESLITATQPREPEGLRQRWLAKLVRNFGDDEGNEAVYTGTILQALLMMNGPELEEAIARSVTLQEARKIAVNDTTGKKTMDYLFLTTLNRPATPKEFQQFRPLLALRGPMAEKDRAEGGPLIDAFWALLNSGAFMLNH